MGNFADTLFSVLFGWLRSAAQWLWSSISQSGENSVLVWLGQNWIWLTLGLCAIGMVIDLCIYLLRWQPYKVWGSFWRRVTGREQHEGDSGRLRRQWVYADGSTEFDEVDAESEEGQGAEFPAAYLNPVEPEQTITQQQEDEPPTRAQRRRRFRAEEDEMPLRYAPPPTMQTTGYYHAPYYPPQWRNPVKDETAVDTEDNGL